MPPDGALFYANTKVPSFFSGVDSRDLYFKYCRHEKPLSHMLLQFLGAPDDTSCLGWHRAGLHIELETQKCTGTDDPVKALGKIDLYPSRYAAGVSHEINLWLTPEQKVIELSPQSLPSSIYVGPSRSTTLYYGVYHGPNGIERQSVVSIDPSGSVRMGGITETGAIIDIPGAGFEDRSFISGKD